MKNSEYFIWLGRAFIGNPEKAYGIMKIWDSPEDFYFDGDKAEKSRGLLTQKDADRIMKISLSECKNALSICKQKNIDIITGDSEYFPEKLKRIPSPPFILYTFGNKELLNETPCVGVVGTRHASDRGIKTAGHFSYDFGSVGITVCNGVAEGIDAAAIKGVLKSGGKTIGVMACSLDVNYPAATREIKKELLEKGGLLISEYPPTTVAYPGNFIPRNRLVSGLSDAILAVEAPKKSGTLITASHAAEQGVDVYAIPSDPYDKNSEGTNALISDGVPVAIKPSDIILPLTVRYPDKINIKNLDENSQSLFFSSPVKERKIEKTDGGDVFRLISEGICDFDVISEKTGIPAAKLTGEIIKLELSGYIEKDEHGNYKPKN